MNKIKGFANIPSLANNAAGQVAIFGELSSLSFSFSRYKTNYANATYPGVELVGFTTVNDLGSQITLTTQTSNHILSVIHWVYSQYLISAVPTNANKANFITQLQTQFPAMTSVVINEILTGTVTQRMPDFIEWSFDDGGTVNKIKIWFADYRFQAQFDEYEIFVYPPVASLNNLNNPIASVSSFISSYNNSGGVINSIGTVTNTNPATRILSYTLVWHDPTTTGPTLDTSWAVVIYGMAGNDNDRIKAAIRAYIASNSVLTNWAIIYPTLYAENEFIIIPTWGKVSVPETGLDPALYTPALEVGELLNLAASIVPPSYATSVTLSSYLMANLVVSSGFWRSTGFLAIGNPGNVGSQFSIKHANKFPDYMNIPSSSPDWGRMTVNTRNWIIALNDAFEKALTLTAISPIPPGYSRVTINGKVFLGFTYDSFSYLVLAKISYPS